MSRRAHVLWDDHLTGYDFGPAHPMDPARLALTMRLAHDLGVTETAQVVAPQAATVAEIGTVHTPSLIAAVRGASASTPGGDPAHGLGTPDVPVFEGMHDAAALVVGATLGAARAVVAGEAVHAFNPAGGLHHAMPDASAGFCVYNDIAIAICDLLDAGIERVAYVDTDVHHGDGVQTRFWTDPRVLTISLHQDPRTLYPGTGWATEVGDGAGKGYSVNLPLPPGVDDAGWLRALYAVVPQLLRAFRPQVLVTQHGCDGHALDPLAHMELSIDGQRLAAVAMHRWSHEYADGRWVATGGGGYAIVDVVPRTWTHVMAELSGQPLDPLTAVPAEWREHVAATFDRVAPRYMTDGLEPVWVDWHDRPATGDLVDEAILATRQAVYPYHGLLP